MKGILYGVGVRSGRSGAADRQGDPAAARVRCGRRTEVRRRQTDRTGYCFAVHRAGQDNPAVQYADDARQAGCGNASHDAAADALCALLDEGKTVVFLTLGDPTVYSTYWYVHKRVAARGYAAEPGARRAVLLRRGCRHGTRTVRGWRNAAHHSGHARQGGGRACALRAARC